MPNATRLCTDCCMFFYSFFPLLQSTAQASRTHTYSAEKEMARQRKGEKFRSPIQTRIFLLLASNIRPIITGVINIAQDSITRALNNNNSCKLSKENFQIYVLDDNVPRFAIETEFLLVLMILSNNFKLLLFTAFFAWHFGQCAFFRSLQLDNTNSFPLQMNSFKAVGFFRRQIWDLRVFSVYTVAAT